MEFSKNAFNTITTVRELLFQPDEEGNVRELLKLFRRRTGHVENDLMLIKEQDGDLSLRMINKQNIYEDGFSINRVEKIDLLQKGSTKADIRDIKKDIKFYLNNGFKPVILTGYKKSANPELA